MRKAFLLSLLLCFISLVSFAQSGANNALILGKVFDTDNNAPLEFATLSVYESENDQLVGGGITDVDGKFSVEVKPGNYYLVLEFISYKQKTVEDLVIERKDEKLDLGTINMSMDGETLDEVVITERKSQVQLSLDKKVFNVGQDLTNKGGTAEDILDNVPSVTVDVEGNVSLRGSGGVRILIDGKPSMMVGGGNNNGLRNIPSNMIERVEVITNPSARYEAEGMAGIINIVLKKDRNRGFNGSFDLTGGFPYTAGTAINTNYRRNKLNLFTRLGVRQRSGPGGGSTLQERNYFAGTSDLFTTESNRNRGGLSSNLNVGMDYFIDDNNIITSSFAFRRSWENNDNTTIYNDFEGDFNNLTSITNRYDDELENEFDTEYALTYDKSLPGKDHKFIADLRFQDNTEIESSDYREEYFNAAGLTTGADNLFQRSNNREGERRLNLKADYTRPLTNKGKFESGLQSSYRRIDNDYLVEEQILGDWTRLASLSNNFNYNEFINAAYGIFGKEYTRWSYQLGLRAEHSRVVTELEQSDEDPNDRSYLNLFPSTHVSYKINETNSLQFSYSRRINRPRFWDLNPFFSFSDPRNQRSGNPNLDPEFTNAFEGAYILYFDKGSLTSSIYYRHTNNVIERITTVVDNINYSRPENLLSSDDFGFEFTGSYDLTKWWNLDGNLNLFRSIIDGGNLGDDFGADTYTWFTRLNNKFTFSKTFEGQLRVNYRAPRLSPQGRSLAIRSVDLGLGKEFPEKNVSVNLNVRDLFNSRRWRWINDFPLLDDDGMQIGDFYSEGAFQWRARQIMVTINYRINQDNKGRKGKRGNGGEYEGGGEEMF